MYVCICIYRYIYVYMYICIYVYMYIYICIYIYMCVCNVYIHIHIYIYIRIFMVICTLVISYAANRSLSVLDDSPYQPVVSAAVVIRNTSNIATSKQTLDDS